MGDSVAMAIAAPMVRMYFFVRRFAKKLRLEAGRSENEEKETDGVLLIMAQKVCPRVAPHLLCTPGQRVVAGLAVAF